MSARSVLGWATALLVAIAALASAPRSALALKCAEDFQEKAFGNAHVVFLGKVLSVELPPELGGGRRVKLRVSRSLKGDAPREAAVTADGFKGGFPFEVGHEYLVFARRDDDGALHVDDCGGTLARERAAELLARLPSGSAPSAAASGSAPPAPSGSASPAPSGSAPAAPAGDSPAAPASQAAPAGDSPPAPVSAPAGAPRSTAASQVHGRGCGSCAVGSTAGAVGLAPGLALALAVATARRLRLRPWRLATRARDGRARPESKIRPATPRAPGA